MIILVHIHKTAGSSLTAAFRRNYGLHIPVFDLDHLYGTKRNFNPASRRRSNMTLIDFSHGGAEEISYINLEQAKLKTAKALGGHLTYNIHNYIPGSHEFHYITLVRNSFDRIFNYIHLMSQPKASKLNRLSDIMFGKCKSDLSLMIDSNELPEFKNDQSRMILGVDEKARFTARDVIEHLHKNYFYVGCTEKYAEVIKHLGGLLNWKDVSDPGIDSHLNTRHADGRNDWFKIVGYNIPQDLIYKVTKANLVDQEVWEHVQHQGPEGYWASVREV